MKDYNMPVLRLQGRDAQTLCKNLCGFRKMQQNACRAGTTKFSLHLVRARAPCYNLLVKVYQPGG